MLNTEQWQYYTGLNIYTFSKSPVGSDRVQNCLGSTTWELAVLKIRSPELIQ